MRRAKQPPAFLVRDLLRQAWRLIRQRPGFLFLGFLFYISVRAFFPMLSIVCLRTVVHLQHRIPSDRVVGAICIPFLLLGLIVGMGVWLGWLRGVLRIARGEPTRWSDLGSGFPVLATGLGTALLTFGAVLGGCILMVVPGVLLLIRFSQSFFVIVDERVGPLAALRRSTVLAKGVRREVLLLLLALLGFNVLGFCLLLVGLFFSVPFSAVTLALAYETLRGRAEKGV